MVYRLRSRDHKKETTRFQGILYLILAILLIAVFLAIFIVLTFLTNDIITSFFISFGSTYLSIIFFEKLSNLWLKKWPFFQREVAAPTTPRVLNFNDVMRVALAILLLLLCIASFVLLMYFTNDLIESFFISLGIKYVLIIFFDHFCSFLLKKWPFFSQKMVLPYKEDSSIIRKKYIELKSQSRNKKLREEFMDLEERNKNFAAFVERQSFNKDFNENMSCVEGYENRYKPRLFIDWQSVSPDSVRSKVPLMSPSFIEWDQKDYIDFE
jgi:hypothetical protein